jgi:hypothetical protein
VGRTPLGQRDDPAAEHYDVSRQTVRRWNARGKIHAYRVEPRLIRVDLDEIEAEIIHTVPTVTLSRADVQKRRATHAHGHARSGAHERP